MTSADDTFHDARTDSLDTAPASCLNEDVTYSQGDADLGTMAGSSQTDTLDRKEREQELAQRDRLFNVVIAIVIVSLLIGLGIIIAYMCIVGGKVDYRVMVTWYGGVAAQTIGVLAVMVRSLFPKEIHRTPPKR